ncbi:cell surface protein [Burkholderia sp. Ac-20379]|uniref:cell surface protein n=1 Tax=Burkholderia sp. Ac-20379 TaxID=2703900 RepID=UPI0019819E1F|nr:cell surface protein [Burkholderia sp. Ac-20379]MBN3722627.1 cell surface protein [Burkholderia sp. Ac-20379]
MKITQFALGASLLALLAACGGGGNDGSTTSGTGSQLSAATSMSGTVAVGTALIGATVSVIDANGNTVNTTTDTNGHYSVGIQGLTAPFVLEAADSSGASNTLFSVVANTNVSNNSPLIANVTPLTTAVGALLTKSGNPGDLIGNPSAITRTAINAAETTLGQALAPIFKANGVSTSIDPISTQFTADQTGLDAVIDSISVTPSAKGTGFQLSSLADSNTAIQLNSSTTTVTALAAPAQPANYLASLQTAMSQCISDVQGGSSITTDTACTTAIATGYLNDSYSTMKARHGGLFSAGSKLTGIKTLAVLPANTLPNTSGPVSLVYFLFTDAAGKSNFASDFVEQTSSGWQVIGNQEQYDLYIASFVGRLQYVDSANSANSRYESGLRILIPVTQNVADSATNTSYTQLGSAVVTGPGLPSGGVGLYLTGSGSGHTGNFSPYLTFPSVASTAPFYCPGGAPPTPCSMSDGTSSEYKWAWAPISSQGSVTVPASSDYTSKSMDTSAIQQFGAYTVTLYDVAGVQAGKPQTVINIASIQAPQVGQQVPWQTLGSDAINSFLTSGGAASVAGVTSLSLNWTASALNPLVPEQILTGEKTQSQATVVEGYVNIAAPSITKNGTSYSATNTKLYTETALSSDVHRLISLIEQVSGDYYMNTWQYGQ